MREAGAGALRGGAFKPRTSPYSFQGLKEKGLELLAVAREETGLAIVTEVMATEHVALVSRYADVLQVGARNMQNYPLLEAVGESRQAGAAQARPVGHDGGVPAGRRVHPQDRQQQRDALRARHPHVRGPHALHAAAGHRALPASKRRTCRSSSIPATAPARPTWWPRWRWPPSPPAPTA